MNTLDEMIEVLQAYKRGESVEFREDEVGATWCKLVDSTVPTWNFWDCEYRVAKPEPRKLYAHIHKASGALIFLESIKTKGSYRVPNLT